MANRNMSAAEHNLSLTQAADLLCREPAYMYSYPHKTAYGNLENVDILSRLRHSVCPELYVHIPFCNSKCGYCNLFSAAGLDEQYFIRYTDALCRQFQGYGLEAKSFRDMTIGGGTPLILPEEQLIRILSLATGSPSPEQARELKICVETAPTETTSAKLRILKDFHVERISIGVQSMHAPELASLGRAQDTANVHRALEQLKRMNFPCVNVDLIYGIPEQNVSSLRESLKLTLGYDPEEIFIYPLYIREGTILYAQGEARTEICAELYAFARDFLTDAGYTQLSMRRFAKTVPGAPKSCGLDDMIGIGCGARTYLGDLHFCSPFALKPERCVRLIENYIGSYTGNCMSGHHAVQAKSSARVRRNSDVNGYILDEDEQKRRFIIKNLMYYTGISTADYRALFHGAAPPDDFPIFEQLRDYGLVERGDSPGADACIQVQNDVASTLSCQDTSGADGEDTHIRLTTAGMALSDEIGPLFISDKVRARMQAWRDE